MKKILGILILVVLALALGMAAGIWVGARERQQENLAAVERLEENVAQQSQEALRQQENLAMWYNLSLKQGDGEAARAYGQILDYGGHLMGYLSCPKAGLKLPICQQSSGSLGLIHVRQSALPIGGKGNHCVLVGQTGLGDGSVLFDLTDLQVGDVFILHTLGKLHTYRVERIQQSKTQPDCPAAEPGRDLCTLMIQDSGRWVCILGERG